MKFYACWTLWTLKTKNATLQLSLKVRKMLSSVTVIVMGQTWTWTEGETGHLPARLLNASAEFMQRHYETGVISDDNLPLTTTPLPSPVDSEGPSPSTHSRVRTEPRTKLQVVKNKNQTFKWSKRPVSAGIPKHTVYSPNAAECIKATQAQWMFSYSCIHPP